MELTSVNVEQTFKECLFKEGEETKDFVEAHAVKMHVGFHPQRLESKRKHIETMLMQLPTQFMETGGGGWSFLNACTTKDGNQWADDHQIVDLLVCLGLATAKVQFQLQRELWQSLPGGMPFFVVKDK